ncbi:MAG: hypothetical protein Q7J26_02630 [Brevundimonas sp.]|uniref:hypothetical protein n=1 Tax=Brevundimonas sp. TaxID=1871086 RepID=UPI0027181C21|nr:hypothetical protein [Brevundimonas sp.]MDO9607395.1 hypothetical protein [Brevundimonas sp.]
MRRLVALGSLGFLIGCGDGDYDKAAADLSASTAEPNRVTAEAAKLHPVEELSGEDKGRVCRAVVASLNGRQPDIIRVISNEGDQYRVRYTRDDGTVWTNDCIVGNGTAQWRMVENGQPGRWRNEDTINFTVNGEKIDVQTFMNGEPITSDSYTVN